MIRRYFNAMLPAAAFAITFALHFLWLGLFPEQDPAQARWAVLPVENSWLDRYVGSQDYWLGYSYALCLAFVSSALRRYRLMKCRTSRNVALGGAGFSGGLAALGCLLIGCCGSPMFLVWANLFGATYLPLAKPILAFVTTLSIGFSWWWMTGKAKRLSSNDTTTSAKPCCER